jgi:DNA-binding beta-propeller fold protein YncE
VNDSRHHGLSMSPDGSKLCVAGTMDEYATIVDRATLQEGALVPANKPYWATVSGDGQDCVISESGADQVSAISFATGQRVATVAVGDHPQRVRIGHIPTGWTAPSAG